MCVCVCESVSVCMRVCRRTYSFSLLKSMESVQTPSVTTPCSLYYNQPLELPANGSFSFSSVCARFWRQFAATKSHPRQLNLHVQSFFLKWMLLTSEQKIDTCIYSENEQSWSANKVRFFQVLNNNSTKQKIIHLIFHRFNRLTVVQVSFCRLTKGITQVLYHAIMIILWGLVQIFFSNLFKTNFSRTFCSYTS